jgi:hypothetical protein
LVSSRYLDINYHNTLEGIMKQPSRREFLRRALHLGIGVAGASVLDIRAALEARAASQSDPPALVVAQGLNDTTITLIWTAVAGADSYVVYRDGEIVASQPGTRYDDSSLTAATTHTYQTSAIVGGVGSLRSAAVSATTQALRDTAPPTQPGSITVSNITSSAATLKWAHSSDNDNIVGYRILRGPSTAALSNLVQLGTTDAVNSYTATNLRANTAYQFAVIALDPSGNLSPARTVTFTTAPSSDSIAPDPPSSSSVTATAFSDTRVDVIWGASTSSDLSGYQVFRDGLLVAEISLPLRRYYSDNGLAPGGTHSYQIRAVDSAGNASALTTGRTVTTLATGTVKIVRGPYLQATTTYSTVVVWWTNILAPSAVSYGIGSLSQQASDPTLTRQHVMLIGGLTAGTTYTYQVVSGSVTSTTSTFNTAALPGSMFAFAAVGDFGGGSPDETRIANNIATGGTEFVQTLGDNVYPDAQDPDFATTYFDCDARFYKPYASVMKQQTIWFANGNKEYYGDGAFWQNVWIPNNKRWYSYDWGDAHILVLDTELPHAPGTPQYQFAEADLVANQSKRWRIALVHRPPYSSISNNSSSTDVRMYLVPLFEQQNVQLVLSGNSHNYERTFPLLGGVPQSSRGVTYIVSGGGGNGLNQFTITQPSWSAFRIATYEHLRITVSPISLQVDAISGDDGSILDSTTITDNSGGSTTGTIAGTVTDSGSGAPIGGANVGYNGSTTTTDATGAYALANAPTGTYTLTASAPGYTSVSQSITVVAGGTMQQDFTLAALRLYVFKDGFESGNLSSWTASAGLTVQTALVRSGTFAAQANTTNGNTYAKKTLANTYTSGYARIYVNLVSSSSQVNLLRFRTASDVSIAYLFVTPTTKLGLRNDITATTVTSATSVGNGWHALELHAVISGASSTIKVWLDGTQINDLTLATDLGTSPIGRLQIGDLYTGGRTYNIVIDDVVFDTQPIGV